MEAVLKEIECGGEAGVRAALADFNDKVRMCVWLAQYVISVQWGFSLVFSQLFSWSKSLGGARLGFITC